MKALRNYLDKIKPNFEEGGKLHAFRSVFDGFETFLFVDTGPVVRYVQRRLPALLGCRPGGRFL